MGTSGRTSGPGRTAVPQSKNMSPQQGVQQAEKRLGKPCYHVGQKVPGIYACVTCQFRINNRGALPACPDCGEIIWAYMGDGPRPIPEGETEVAPVAQPDVDPNAEEVELQAPAQSSVVVEEGINLEM